MPGTPTFKVQPNVGRSRCDLPLQQTSPANGNDLKPLYDWGEIRKLYNFDVLNWAGIYLLILKYYFILICLKRARYCNNPGAKKVLQAFKQLCRLFQISMVGKIQIQILWKLKWISYLFHYLISVFILDLSYNGKTESTNDEISPTSAGCSFSTDENMNVSILTRNKNLPVQAKVFNIEIV